MMPMIIRTTQHPVKLVAFGGFRCARNTFKRVSIPTKVEKYIRIAVFLMPEL